MFVSRTHKLKYISYSFKYFSLPLTIHLNKVIIQSLLAWPAAKILSIHKEPILYEVWTEGFTTNIGFCLLNEGHRHLPLLALKQQVSIPHQFLTWANIKVKVSVSTQMITSYNVHDSK